jgi:hypothetical protein
MFGRYVGPVFTFVPACVIGFLGVVYVRSVIGAIPSYSEPFTASIPAGTSELDVRLWKPRLNPWTKSGALERLEIREKNGKLLAAVREAEGGFNSKGVIVARASKVWGRVERRKDGTFEIETYLKGPKQEPQDQPFEVTVDRADLRYVDQLAGWTQPVQLIQTYAAGNRDRVVGRTRSRLDGIGRIDGHFQSGEKEGVSAWGSLDVEVAPLLPPLRKMRETRSIQELARLSIGSLRASGPFTLASRGNQFGFATRVTGSGKNLQFEQYRASSAVFVGDLTDRGFRGKIDGADAGLSGRFDGEIAFGMKPRVRGNVDASIPSSATLPTWIAKTLPRDFRSDRSSATGWVDWNGAQLRTQAKVQMARGAVAGQGIEALEGVVSSDGKTTLMQVEKGTWKGAPVTGAIALQGNSLSGFVQAKRIDFAKVGRDYGVRDLSGTGNVVAVLGGNTNQPQVDFAVDGNLVSSLTGQRLYLGLVQARGRVDGNSLRVQQFLVDGPQGRVSGTGTVGLRDQRYVFDLRGTSLNLASFAADLKGSGAYAGRLTGRGAQFSTIGKVEAFDVETAGQKLDYVTAELVADSKSARANNFTALSQGTLARGWASLHFRDQLLGGEFAASGIRLENFVAKDQPIAGFASVRNGKLGGTLNKPQVDADLSGEALVAGNLRFDQLTSKVRLRGEQITVRDLFLKAPEGSVTGTLAASIGSKTGTFTLKAQGVEIGSLLPDLATTAALEGKITGDVAGTFSEAGLLSAEGKADVEQVFVNGTLMGSGPIAFRKVGPNYEGSATVGQIGQFFDVPQFSYNPEQKNLNATFTASTVPIDQLYAVSRRYIEPNGSEPPLLTLPDEVLKQLRTLEGTVSIAGTAGGPVENLVLENVQVNLDQLKQNEAELGSVAATFQRTDRIWTLDNLKWQFRKPADPKDAVPTLLAKGTYDETGKTSIEGSLSALEASWFAWLSPDLTNVDGTVSSELFRISGDAKKPDIQASLNYTGRRDPEKPAERQIDILASLEAGKLSFDGNYYLAGFTGPLTASIPFDYDKGFSGETPITASASLDARKLSELTEFFPWLDVEKSRGLIGGRINVAGTLSKPLLTGDAELLSQDGQPNAIAAKSSAIGGSQVPSAQNIVAKLTLDQDRVRLNAEAESSEGGKLFVQDLGLKLEGIESYIAGDIDRLFENSVFGSVRLQDFRVSYRDRAGLSKTALNGEITVSDVLARPLIAGRLTAKSTAVAIPEFPATEGETPQYAVNPRFDLRVDMLDPVSLNAGTGNFTIIGFGELGGSLTDPAFISELQVQGGFLRLPNARIALDRDGEIRITYQNGLAVADLNLSGRTAVTAQGLSGVPDRYDVLLGIRGNLLREGGLILTASSDPPDLAQDRILALLGQRELIAGIASETNAGSQIQSALLGVAVPYVAGALTDSLAQTLGLDFLNVDYNTFDQVSLSAGINLGKNFSLFARRQLSQPLPGLAQKFEVKLSYRPSFLKSQLARRLRFSFGIDQDRPWKIGLEYGIRF